MIKQALKGFTQRNFSFTQAEDRKMSSEYVPETDEVVFTRSGSTIAVNHKWRDFGGMKARILGECTRWDQTWVQWEFESGLNFPPHFHDWDEGLLVLSGKCELFVGEEKVTMTPESGLRTVDRGVIHGGYFPVKTVMVTMSTPALGGSSSGKVVV